VGAGREVKFEISESFGSGDDAGMVRGDRLYKEEPPEWGAGSSFLLLNPRMPDALRRQILAADFPDLPDHVWLATSGTGGCFKLVALARKALEASARAVNAHLGASADDVWINPLPLFHVGGLGILVRVHLAGSRGEMIRGAWDPQQFVEAVRRCDATLSALVPTQVHDLVQAGFAAPECLRGVVVGGGVLTEDLFARAAGLGWPLLPSYGLTEAASQVATAAPGCGASAWLPLLSHMEARMGGGGVLELRGDSLLTGLMIFDASGTARWEDPKNGGWYRTGDRAELRGGEVRVVGRVDDLVKIRGELVDVAALERALQELVPSGLVRLNVERDERTGSKLRVCAENQSALAEARSVLEIFPPYARPEICEVTPIERNALGKVVRSR
jgi:O-succinylbenzoic acid--CoA ligase